MTSESTAVGPACPDALPADAPTTPLGLLAGNPTRLLRVERQSVDTIDQATWDALAARNPWATPFSAWAFQRAWWDAYGPNAHDETLAVLDPTLPAGAPPVAILPLMRRHVVEPSDGATHTQLRHGSAGDLHPLPSSARALYAGASYHADYATLLAAPADAADACRAIADHLGADPAATTGALPGPAADPGPAAVAGPAADPGSAAVAGPRAVTAPRAATAPPWDVIDLRRLRCGDPAGDALAAAFEARAAGHAWTVTVDREDVCPVAHVPEGADFDGFLATLDKKGRHEIRRKIRRAEAAGEVRLDPSDDPLADLDAFVDLHQRRWGADGLFPPTIGGDQSRVFLRRLFEALGPDGPVRLAFLSVGGRRIGAGIHFETDDAFLYYNAGTDPDALSLSPGVVMVACYVQWAIARGRRRLDFLRGNEGYKYEWGAVDEPIRRILVRRAGLEAGA